MFVFLFVCSHASLFICCLYLWGFFFCVSVLFTYLFVCCVVCQARKWHDGSEKFGRRWSEGDVVGCLLNLDEGTMCESHGTS